MLTMATCEGVVLGGTLGAPVLGRSDCPTRQRMATRRMHLQPNRAFRTTAPPRSPAWALANDARPSNAAHILSSASAQRLAPSARWGITTR